MRQEYKRFIAIWVALMVLLLLTFGSAFLRLGVWNSIINFAIAAMKAMLVGLFFMRLWSARAIVRVAVGVAFFTLALLFAISSSDYATRKMYRTPWHASPAATQGG